MVWLLCLALVTSMETRGDTNSNKFSKLIYEPLCFSWICSVQRKPRQIGEHFPWQSKISLRIWGYHWLCLFFPLMHWNLLSPTASLWITLCCKLRSGNDCLTQESQSLFILAPSFPTQLISFKLCNIIAAARYLWRRCVWDWKSRNTFLTTAGVSTQLVLAFCQIIHYQMEQTRPHCAYKTQGGHWSSQIVLQRVSGCAAEQSPPAS